MSLGGPQFDVSSKPTSTDTTSTQGGTAAVGSGAVGSSAVSLTSAGGINLSMESPEAISAAAATTLAALQTNYETAAGSLRIAANLADNAMGNLANQTESTTKQVGNILIPLGIAAAIALGLYFILKRG